VRKRYRLTELRNIDDFVDIKMREKYMSNLEKKYSVPMIGTVNTEIEVMAVSKEDAIEKASFVHIDGRDLEVDWDMYYLENGSEIEEMGVA
jgi:hypothetical protein